MRRISSRGMRWLERELPLLVQERILPEQTAERMLNHYRELGGGFSWAITVFAVLGSLLIGGGIILLFAHNWDELGRPLRAVLSFCPLIAGIVLSSIALLKKGGAALRESAGLFHALAVGASIALIGQTYHLPSDVPAFVLIWALLILPLIFLLDSTGAFLMYLALICGWTGLAQEAYGQAAGFWVLLIPAVVRCILKVRADRNAPVTVLNLSGLLIAFCIAIGAAFERTVPGLWIVAYSAFLSAAALCGTHCGFENDGLGNPLKTIGVGGIAVLTYIFTWSGFWEEVGWNYIRLSRGYREWGVWFDGLICIALLACWVFAALHSVRRRTAETFALGLFAPVALICYALASSVSGFEIVNTLIFNAYMFVFGLMYVVLGCRRVQLGALNGGMAVLTLLLVSRFFDVDFGFLARGLAFIAIGICFLTANLVMARRRKREEARQ